MTSFSPAIPVADLETPNWGNWIEKEHSFEISGWSKLDRSFLQRDRRQQIVADRAKTCPSFARRFPEMTFDPETIMPTQKWVHRDAVHELVALDNWSDFNEPAIAFMIDGRCILEDGHHRLVASLLRGDKEFPLRIIS